MQSGSQMELVSELMTPDARQTLQEALLEKNVDLRGIFDFLSTIENIDEFTTSKSHLSSYEKKSVPDNEQDRDLFNKMFDKLLQAGFTQYDLSGLDKALPFAIEFLDAVKYAGSRNSDDSNETIEENARIKKEYYSIIAPHYDMGLFKTLVKDIGLSIAIDSEAKLLAIRYFLGLHAIKETKQHAQLKHLYLTIFYPLFAGKSENLFDKLIRIIQQRQYSDLDHCAVLKSFCHKLTHLENAKAIKLINELVIEIADIYLDEPGQHIINQHEKSFASDLLGLLNKKLDFALQQTNEQTKLSSAQKRLEIHLAKIKSEHTTNCTQVNAANLSMIAIKDQLQPMPIIIAKLHNETIEFERCIQILSPIKIEHGAKHLSKMLLDLSAELASIQSNKKGLITIYDDLNKQRNPISADDPRRIFDSIQNILDTLANDLAKNVDTSKKKLADIQIAEIHAAAMIRINKLLHLPTFMPKEEKAIADQAINELKSQLSQGEMDITATITSNTEEILLKIFNLEHQIHSVQKEIAYEQTQLDSLFAAAKALFDNFKLIENRHIHFAKRLTQLAEKIYAFHDTAQTDSEITQVDNTKASTQTPVISPFDRYLMSATSDVGTGHSLLDELHEADTLAQDSIRDDAAVTITEMKEEKNEIEYQTLLSLKELAKQQYEHLQLLQNRYLRGRGKEVKSKFICDVIASKTSSSLIEIIKTYFIKCRLDEKYKITIQGIKKKESLASKAQSAVKKLSATSEITGNEELSATHLQNIKDSAILFYILHNNIVCDKVVLDYLTQIDCYQDINIQVKDEQERRVVKEQLQIYISEIQESTRRLSYNISVIRSTMAKQIALSAATALLRSCSTHIRHLSQQKRSLMNYVTNFFHTDNNQSNKSIYSDKINLIIHFMDSMDKLDLTTANHRNELARQIQIFSESFSAKNAKSFTVVMP